MRKSTLTPFGRVTASRVDRLTLALPSVSGGITASAATRQLSGPVVRYGDVGRTSAGRLRVAPGALRFAPDLGAVKLTREHDRDQSRGHLIGVQDDPRPGGILRITARVSDGPDGDAALQEAVDRTRDGFSFDVVDAVVEGDTITSALVVAIGQVGIPAYDGMRIDTIAASLQEGTTMDDEQRARLRELLDAQQLTDEQRVELDQLQAAAARELLGQTDEPTDPPADPAPADPAPATVTASAARLASVPVGAGPRRPASRTAPRAGQALHDFVQAIVDGYGSGARGQGITAALADVTFSGIGVDVTTPAWSAELWSGLAYEPEFTPLLASGELTAMKGEGWRWVTKPEMKDYAGDKAAIPSDPIDTEPGSWSAARMAVGHDFDRSFYDFPDYGFLASYVAACRESWAVKLDAKVEAWIIANAAATGIAATTSLLKAAQIAVRKVKRNRAGRASFVIVNDDDFDALLDVTNQDVSAFLDLLGVRPEAFTSSASVAAGTVIAGAKASAEVKTLPGSPIRATAQHLANAGVDEAFFGYWAIEQHHETGIVKQTFA